MKANEGVQRRYTPPISNWISSAALTFCRVFEKGKGEGERESKKQVTLVDPLYLYQVASYQLCVSVSASVCVYVCGCLYMWIHLCMCLCVFVTVYQYLKEGNDCYLLGNFTQYSRKRQLAFVLPFSESYWRAQISMNTFTESAKKLT